jgi:hypothetical protein
MNRQCRQISLGGRLQIGCLDIHIFCGQLCGKLDLRWTACPYFRGPKQIDEQIGNYIWPLSNQRLMRQNRLSQSAAAVFCPRVKPTEQVGLTKIGRAVHNDVNPQDRNEKKPAHLAARGLIQFKRVGGDRVTITRCNIVVRFISVIADIHALIRCKKQKPASTAYGFSGLRLYRSFEEDFL